MSLIINQILPLVSILDARIVNIIWFLFLLLDAIAYSVVAYVYDIFQIIAQLNFSVISSWAQPLINRVEALIMVLILFKLGMSFIQYMITPEKFNEKGTGGSALLINIVICAVLLVSYQFIFNVLNEFSMLIIGYPDGYEFTVLKQIADVESENGGDEAGLLGRFIFGENADMKDFSSQLAGLTLFSFLKDTKGNMAQSTLGEILTDAKNGDTNFFKITNLDEYIYTDNNATVCVEYTYPLLSTAVGLYLAYTLIVLTIEVAIRMFKLIILQVTSPIAIVTTIDGGIKSKTFQSFYKTYISVYTGLFIRVLVVYLVSALVNMFAQNLDSLNIGVSSSSLIGKFVLIVIIVSLFTFAKKIPSFIDKALGLNSSGDGEGAAGFKGLMKSMGAAVGLGAGALGGMAVGAAAGGVGGAVSGLFGGAYRGATGGYRANNVADFFKNQRSGMATSRDNALRARANGGFFKNAAAGIGAATGYTALKDASLNRQITDENNRWKEEQDKFEKADQAYQDNLESRGNNTCDVQTIDASGTTTTQTIEYGTDIEAFADKYVSIDADVKNAEDTLNNYIRSGAGDAGKIMQYQEEVRVAKENSRKAAKNKFYENLSGTGNAADGKKIMDDHKALETEHKSNERKHNRTIKDLNDKMSNKPKDK